jgi:hypothetical protein
MPRWPSWWSFWISENTQGCQCSITQIWNQHICLDAQNIAYVDHIAWLSEKSGFGHWASRFTIQYTTRDTTNYCRYIDTETPCDSVNYCLVHHRLFNVQPNCPIKNLFCTNCIEQQLISGLAIFLEDEWTNWFTYMFKRIIRYVKYFGNYNAEYMVYRKYGEQDVIWLYSIVHRLWESAGSWPRHGARRELDCGECQVLCVQRPLPGHGGRRDGHVSGRCHVVRSTTTM